MCSEEFSALPRRIAVIGVLACVAFLPLTACASDNSASAPATFTVPASRATTESPIPGIVTTTAESPAPSLTLTPGAGSPEPTLTPGAGSPEPTLTPGAGSPEPTVTPGDGPAGPEPTTKPSPPSPGPNGGGQVDTSDLVTANAYWRRPDFLNVDQPAQIGLGIQSAPLTTQINAAINAIQGRNESAGQIRVSPQATAQLFASPSDAEVTPSGSQNTSLDEDIQMSWQWTITPKRPTSDLILTAYVVVHVEGGPDAVITTPLTLHVPVHRTTSYTFGRIFSNWGTWSAIVAAVAGGAGWIFKRTKRSRSSA